MSDVFVEAVSLKTAESMIERCIRAKLVPFVQGSPGLGKSAVVRELAKTYNLKLLDVRLAQVEPTDLNGFPHIADGRSSYAPPTYLPLEGDELPVDAAGKPMNGWLLFLDEFNSADRDVQKASYKLILDRMVGEHHIHKNVAMVCAGNLATDNAIVEEMSTALQSRLVHMVTEVSAEEWLEWARSHNIDARITSFIAFKPDLLYHFQPDSPDATFPCPRTWEFANALLQHQTPLTPLDVTLLKGTIGTGAAVEFSTFAEIADSLPKLSDILANPETLEMPAEPGVLYAMTGAIGSAANDQNIDDLMKFVVRMAPEYTITTLREMLARNPQLEHTTAVTNWKTQFAMQMM